MNKYKAQALVTDFRNSGYRLLGDTVVAVVLIRLTPNHTKYDMELLKLPLLDSSTGICFSLAFPWKRGSPQVRSCCSWSSRHSGITPRRSIAGFGRRVGRCPMGWSLWTAG